MTFKIFEYDKCETCRKALRFLDENKIAYTKIAIVETPPTKTELLTVLSSVQKNGGSIKNLLNRSGQVYREMKLGAKLASMSESDVIDLLAKHGKLIKRPLLIGTDIQLVGFQEEEWRAAFGLPAKIVAEETNSGGDDSAGSDVKNKKPFVIPRRRRGEKPAAELL